MAQNLQEEGFTKQENFLTPERVRFLVFGLLFVGLFVLALGAGLVVFRNSQKSAIEILPQTASSSVAANAVFVHVDGAVTRPGVYSLSADARTKDAVEAAGGLSADADLTRINLASKISDGQKIHIQRIGEGGSQLTLPMSGQAVNSSQTDSALININTASAVDLDKLPGIGPATANKIISLRPYTRAEDLVSKRAVSSSVFEKIKSQITAN